MKKNIEFNNFFGVNLVIALALLGSAFTQFRFSDLPIGVSDIFFLLYIIYSLGLFSISFNNHHSYKVMDPTRRLIIPILLFLVFFLLLNFAGSIYSSLLLTSGSLPLPWNPEGASLLISPYRNIVAFSYLMIIFTVLFIRADIDIGSVAFYTLLLLSFAIAFFYIVSIFTNNIFGRNLYYVANEGTQWTDRLILFAKNPNQLADFIAPLPFFLLYFIKNSKSALFTLLISTLIALVVLTALEASSKSLLLGWIIAIVYLLIHYIFRGKYAMYLISTLVFFSTTVLFYFHINYSDSIINVLQNLFDSSGAMTIDNSIVYDMLIRVKLISNAIEAGYLSPVFGLGSGASSGVFETFQGRESHNHFSEIFMTSGILGLLSYLGLMLYVFSKISSAREPFLMSVLIVITVTSMFHLQLRQPLFWFYILFLLYYTSNFSKKEQKYD